MNINLPYYFCICSLGASLLTSNNAYSKEEDPLFIGGVQASSNSSYSYGGLIIPIWGGKLGQGWFNRSIASYLTYEYRTTVNGQDVKVKAKAPGADVGLGYSWAGRSYGINLSGAIGYRYFDLKPQLPENDPKGSVYYFSPQLQARYNFTSKLDADLISSYTYGKKSAESFFNRVRFGYMPTYDWRFGLEDIYQEGNNYRIKQYGLFATTYFSNGLGVELNGGVGEDLNSSGSPYFGISFSKQF